MRTFSACAIMALVLLAPTGVLAAPLIPVSTLNPQPMLLEAKLVCGMFDGKFRCKKIDDGTHGIEIGGDKKKGTGNKTDGSNGNGDATGNAGDGGNQPGEAGGMDDDQGQGQGAPETGEETAEKPGCPEGYKLLDPPSKYGPCEPPGGLPNAAYKVCPPGAPGTPPNCVCPGQSDYGTMGNKCMGWTGACGTDKPGWNNPNFFCKAAEKIDCKMLPDGKEKCCCKTYNQ